MKLSIALLLSLALVATGCDSRKGGVVILMDAVGGSPGGGADAGVGGAGDGAATGDPDAAGTGETCTPTTCAAELATCGQIPDGCGGILSCGDCPEGQSCGGGGVQSSCGVGTCSPKTCASAGASCGPIADGCGLVIGCGDCPAGQSCGADTPNQCACSPTPCAASGAGCGSVPDGCGGTLDCGGCPGGQSCGGGGVPNVCGEGSCVPLTCADVGATCGAASDGCGGTTECGDCPSGEHCADNQCVCTPKSCADLADDPCGSLPDGCGGSLDCGPCPLCLSGCPAGYDCVAGDVCAGGSPLDLKLDVRSHAVHALLLANGQPAKAKSGCYDGTYDEYDVWTVEFVDKERGYTIKASGNCAKPTTFDVELFPGTYEVRAGGSATETNLPGWGEVVYDALVVDGPITKLVLDVKSHKVHAALLANGQPAKASSGCYDGTYDEYDVWTVEFVEKTRGYTIKTSGNCAKPTTFDVELFPGTYEVRAGGSPTETNLPGWAEVVHDALVVDGPITKLVLDVKSHKVHALLLANGQPAKAKSGCYDGTYDEYDVWTVEFVEKTRGYSIKASGDCADPMTFDVELFPGTYEVRAGGNPTETNLPGWGEVVEDALAVQAPIAKLVLDVKSHAVHGLLLANGQAAKAKAGCYDGTYGEYDVWTVEFVEKERGYSIKAAGGCAAPMIFDVALFPGTYEVRAGGSPKETNLPGWGEVVKDALVVQAPIPKLDLDVKSHKVHVLLLANGQPAKAKAGCYDGTYGEYDVWTVEFLDKERGYSIKASGGCDKPTTFDMELFPGTYEVRAGGSPKETNLPGWGEVVHGALAVEAPIAKLLVDVTSVDIHGTLLANGQAAKAKSGCYDGTYHEYEVWAVELWELERGYTLKASGACADPMVFDLAVFPGVYQVRAGGSPSETNLPGWGEVVIDKLQIP